MTRIFLSLISLSLLLYTPYAFGEMGMSFLGENHSESTVVNKNKEPRALLSETTWKAYVARKYAFPSTTGNIYSVYYDPSQSKTYTKGSTQKTEVSTSITTQKTTSKSVVNLHGSKKLEQVSPDKTILSKVQTNPSTTISQPKKSNKTIYNNVSNKEKTLHSQKENLKEQEKKSPSILEPIPSIRPSII